MTDHPVVKQFPNDPTAVRDCWEVVLLERTALVVLALPAVFDEVGEHQGEEVFFLCESGKSLMKAMSLLRIR
jgi:hypothetical protein